MIMIHYLFHLDSTHFILEGVNDLSIYLYNPIHSHFDYLNLI